MRWKLDRAREKMSWLFGENKENARPKLCPACGTLVGSSVLEPLAATGHDS